MSANRNISHLENDVNTDIKLIFSLNPTFSNATKLLVRVVKSYIVAIQNGKGEEFMLCTTPIRASPYD